MPRIPLHSVNISECSGMRGAGLNAPRKIDIMRHTACGLAHALPHTSQRTSCLKTRCERRHAMRGAWGTRDRPSHTTAAAGLWWRRCRCCVPVLPCAVARHAAPLVSRVCLPSPSGGPACGRIRVRGGYRDEKEMWRDEVRGCWARGSPAKHEGSCRSGETSPRSRGTSKQYRA